MAALSRLPGRHLAWLAIAAAAVVVTAWPPYEAPGKPIRSDCIGYHLWIRESLTGRLSFCDYRVLKKKNAISYVNDERDTCLNKYPPGVAVLRFPVMAPLIDRRPGAPLIGTAEHTASLWISAALLVVCCWGATASAFRLGAPAWATNASVLAVTLGTGLFHYGTFDGCFSHIHSAFLLTLLVWLLLRSLAGGAVSHGASWGVAALAFLLFLVRGTNLLLILWVAGAVLAAGTPPGWPPRRSRVIQVMLPLLAGAALAAALQVTYNSWAAGHLLFSSYNAEGFLWHRPMLPAVLLSYERGLFSYYPVVAVVLAAGLACAFTRRATVAVSALVLAYAALYGFWGSWMLGGGFGHRGFVDLTPLLIPLFAVALGRLAWWSRGIVLVLAAVAVFVALEIMAGYWLRTFPYQGATREAYWSHVVGEHSLLQAFNRRAIERPDPAERGEPTGSR